MKHRMFTNLNHNVFEYASLRRNWYMEGVAQKIRTLSFEQIELDTVQRNLSTVVAAVGRSRNNVHRILQQEAIPSIQSVQYNECSHCSS